MHFTAIPGRTNLGRGLTRHLSRYVPLLSIIAIAIGLLASTDPAKYATDAVAPSSAKQVAAAAASADRRQRLSDECLIYEQMFPSSIFNIPIGSSGSYGRVYRLQPYEDGSDLSAADVGRLYNQIIHNTGGAMSPWAAVPMAKVVQAFASWRLGDVAECDFDEMARAVSPQAFTVHAKIVSPGEEADQAFTRAFFVDADTALLLVRSYGANRAGYERELVVAFRESPKHEDRWNLFHYTFEKVCFACQVIQEERQKGARRPTARP